MNHYTLNTGHNRHSPRSEVVERAIDVCRPLLTPGEHPMPGPPGYRLEVPKGEHGWLGTVYRGNVPLVMFGLADSPESAAEIWTQLESLYLSLTDSGPFAAVNFAAPKQPSLPWCAAATILPDPAMHWLGDFERCIAWAWLEKTAAATT